MPVVKGEELTPDEALALDLCPECGRPLAETNPGEHAAAHWPRPASEEGKRREKMILEWGAAHPKPASAKD
jgi:hypothetical protein